MGRCSLDKLVPVTISDTAGGFFVAWVCGVVYFVTLSNLATSSRPHCVGSIFLAHILLRSLYTKGRSCSIRALACGTELGVIRTKAFSCAEVLVCDYSRFETCWVGYQ